MQKYEMLLLLDSGLAEEVREAELKKFEDLIVSLGGVVEATDKWGVKKTAYPVKFKTDAFYALTSFQAEGSAIAELDRVAGLSGNVLRRVITKVE